MVTSKALTETQTDELREVLDDIVDALEDCNAAVQQNITLFELHVDALLIGIDLTATITEQNTKTANISAKIAKLRTWLDYDG